MNGKVLFLIAFLLFLLTPLTTFANGAKMSENPTESKLTFDGNSGITLLEETVRFKIDSPFSYSKVEIQYRLKNTTNIEQNFNMYFATSKGDKLTANVNGTQIKDIKYSRGDTPPANWSIKPINVLEPTSKNTFKIYYSNANPLEINSSTIPLKFKPNETIILDMIYDNEAGYESNHFINSVYYHIYYLTPAKFWTGKAKVHLVIENTSGIPLKLNSNIDLTKSNNIYETFLSEIPDKEWLFSFSSAKGLYFNTNYIFFNNIVTLVLTTILLVIPFTFKRKTKKVIYSFMLSALAIFILLIKLNYDIFFLLMITLPISSILLILLVIFIRIKIDKIT